MKHTKHGLIGVIVTIGLGLSAGAGAQDDADAQKKKMLTDPLTRAELQCVKLRADAANGTDEQKQKAEEACAKAIEWAKEMEAKKAKNKPKPVPESVPEADPNS